MCNKKYACGCLIAVIISIIVAVIVANLVTSLSIIGIIAGIIVALVFAVVALISFAIISSDKNDKCICEKGKCLVIGALGTIVTGLIALSIITELTTLVIFIIALVTFFFTLTIISVAILFLCLTDCEKMCDY